MPKLLLYGLVVFLLLGVTLAEKILTTLGFDTNILLVALVGLVITRLVMFRSGLLLATVGVITALIYLPTAMHRMHVDPDILIATLAAIIIAPELIGRNR